MQQNTSEWLEWRRKGIGGSDAPVIMDLSPYTTKFQLWEEKVLGTKKKENNYIQEKGHRLETVARAIYETLNGGSYLPKLVEHKEYPFLRASLDGYNEEDNTAVEFKFVGKEVLEEASKTRSIPESHGHFYPQIQHQYMVTGCKKIDLCLYNDELKRASILTIGLDENYIKDLFKKEKEFWEQIQTKTAPPLGPKDSKQIMGHEIQRLISQWKTLKADLEIAEEREEAIRKEIIEKMTHPKNTYQDVTINKSIRAGSVDYSKIPELKNVDLEKYRKNPSPVWTFTVKKQKKQEAKD